MTRHGVKRSTTIGRATAAARVDLNDNPRFPNGKAFSIAAWHEFGAGGLGRGDLAASGPQQAAGREALASNKLARK
jgi:hypothetical protein